MARDANYPFAYSKYEGQLVEAKVNILLSLSLSLLLHRTSSIVAY